MDSSAVSAAVRRFYEDHPYPPPVDDLDAYRKIWDDRRRRVDSHLFWPAEAYRDDRSVLVAGCGTTQAAHYAARWPRARVTGIDVSERSVAFTRDLKQRYALDNLQVHQMPVERAAELGQTFDHVVCTGVLHHLSDPDAGLRALRDVLAPSGAMHLMLYAPYGRAGVYMLQEYCRLLRVGQTTAEIADLAASLRALPPDHPIAPLLRNSPDFASEAGLADALLHPQDRSYSVPQFMEFLRRANLAFGRWIRQAPYLPWCGAPAQTPHTSKLVRLPLDQQYAALELLRGTMTRHSAVVYKTEDVAQRASIDFNQNRWRGYRPVRVCDTLVIRDRLPPGAAAVLINRNHTFTDLYLPIDAAQVRLLGEIDGRRTIAQICEGGEPAAARTLFRRLWQWDQVVFDSSGMSLKG